MRNKKLLVLFIAVSLVGGVFTGCSSSSSSVEKDTVTVDSEVEDTTSTESEETETEEESSDTIGSTLVKDFKIAVTNLDSTESIATDIASDKKFEVYNLVTAPVEEGFLNGFDNEIKGFSEGTLFSPMIGTIPFVAYVFKTDNTDVLVETLKSNANLNWNICTSADEITVEVSGDYVLFAMTPNTIED